MSLWPAIEQAIAAAQGSAFLLARRQSAGGGCINEAWILEGEQGERWFLKLNAAHLLDMFEAEAHGLQELAKGGLRVPRPLAWGQAAGRAYLVLEYLPLGGRGDSVALGEGLARQHQVQAPRFGWHRDNTIGATPQPNAWLDDWIAFLRERRLGHQLALAAEQGYRGPLQERGARLLEELEEFFVGYTPQPALLHGDLWSGNVGYTREGEPVIFDPAVYYGDREADLAMTELFGGFPPQFYQAYRAVAPLDPGYAVRRELYNLYHILNHLNLFGSGYLHQAEAMLDRLLAELG